MGDRGGNPRAFTQIPCSLYQGINCSVLPVEALWLGEFKHALPAFPSSRHDDQIDALSQMLIWVDRQQRFDSMPIAAPIIISIDDPDDYWPGLHDAIITRGLS